MATSTGFWENDAGASSTYSLLSGKSPNRFHLMRLLRKRNMREFGEIIFTALAENTPSDEASVTLSQKTAVATPDSGENSQGGVQAVAAINLMGSSLDSAIGDASANTARNAKAGDVTIINAEVLPGGNTALRAPSVSGTITYPTDASGNGGGGKFDQGF